MEPNELHKQADLEGKARADACIPTPMVVGAYTYESGAIGFAWVIFAGNTSFGKYMFKEGLANRRYGQPGLSMWCGGYGQSYEKKLAYARGYYSVLSAHGLKGYAGHVMD